MRKDVKIDGEKSSYLLNDLRNFDRFFRKDVNYDNIDKNRPLSSLNNTFLEKPNGLGSN